MVDKVLKARLLVMAKFRKQVEGRKQLTTFLLEPRIHKRLSITAAAEGMSLGRALREAVNLWLKQKRTRKGGQMGP